MQECPQRQRQQQGAQRRPPEMPASRLQRKAARQYRHSSPSRSLRSSNRRLVLHPPMSKRVESVPPLQGHRPHKFARKSERYQPPARRLHPECGTLGSSVSQALAPENPLSPKDPLGETLRLDRLEFERPPPRNPRARCPGKQSEVGSPQHSHLPQDSHALRSNQQGVWMSLAPKRYGCEARGSSHSPLT